MKVASIVSKIKEDMLAATSILFHLDEQYSLERVTGFPSGLLIGSQIVASQQIRTKYMYETEFGNLPDGFVSQ